MAIFEIAVNIQTLSFNATLSPEEIQNVKQRLSLDGFLFLTTSFHCAISDLNPAVD